MLCRDVVRERGVHNLKADDLIAEITSKGRALVPDSVKKELLQKIKAYLVQDM
jgi:enhancer of yellow 2 transcription factor